MLQVEDAMFVGAKGLTISTALDCFRHYSGSLLMEYVCPALKY